MAKPRIHRLPAVVLTIVGLLAAGHISATLAFTGPNTPLKESLQPTLNSYFRGPLDQGWSLFAPAPYSKDEYMVVRACLSEYDVCAGGADAGAELTPWRNVTEDEFAEIDYNIFADRGARQSKVMHGRFWSAASNLTGEQQTTAEGNHIDGEPVFGVDLYSSEAEETYSSSQLSNLRRYQRLEDAAVGLGSLYMYEDYGDEVTLVEVRMLREAVPPFSKRRDPSAELSQSWLNIGWRPATEFDEEVYAAWS
ncbi:DUF5819 family protein [Brachybacterium alimentarium]|uniref:DUF5819 family protein n=1 Tax=Brachybacterium alimentarium TaxID=47845 RepID=UPI000DF4AD5C|nr:DUF5819 family protein [Brachybacterium alimentarium]RCS89717.1 hypothetical protein CIK69_09030 [Brachybacterium alimentarium]